MPLEVKIPEVGESITEVTIANWLVKDGDVVEIDQPLCEIDSDKATFEVPAEAGGTVKIIAKAGDTIKVGDVIATIDSAGTGAKTASQKKETSKANATEKQ